MEAIMKVWAKILCVATMSSVFVGCSSTHVYVPKIPPAAQAKLLDYAEQPDNKVFVIAIDPGGDFAFAYDYGKSTLKEAAKVAVEKCDASREAMGVVSKPYIYAINDKVVFEEMIIRAEKARLEAKAEMSEEQQAQVDEAARQDESGEANQ